MERVTLVIQDVPAVVPKCLDSGRPKRVQSLSPISARHGARTVTSTSTFETCYLCLPLVPSLLGLQRTPALTREPPWGLRGVSSEDRGKQEAEAAPYPAEPQPSGAGPAEQGSGAAAGPWGGRGPGGAVRAAAAPPRGSAGGRGPARPPFAAPRGPAGTAGAPCPRPQTVSRHGSALHYDCRLRTWLCQPFLQNEDLERQLFPGCEQRAGAGHWSNRGLMDWGSIEFRRGDYFFSNDVFYILHPIKL